ncbi:MAG TPA: ATP-binding protein, partial [Gemmatimonadaceae bacterium]|nr:ATP-binding protein [Gemmatimonadaceae bacterium]
EHQVEEAQALAEELEQTNEELRRVNDALERAAAEARAERARITATLEGLDDAVSVFDREWRWVYLNPSARAIVRTLGLDPDAILGRVVWDELPSFRGTRFEEQARRAMAEGRVVEYEENYVAEMGRWFETRVVPGAELVTTFTRDVTARHRAAAALRSREARYRALVEASTLMVWNTTPDGLVEDMPFWRDLTAQTPEEVRGNGWTNAIHPDDRPRVFETWRRSYESRALYESEYRLRLRDGSYRWFRARGVPVIGPDGAVLEWVGVFDDVDADRNAQAVRSLLDRASEVLAGSLDVRSTLRAVARLAVEPAAPGLGPLADLARIDLPAGDPSGGLYECLAFESTDEAMTRAYRALESGAPVPADAGAGFPRVIATGEPDLVQDFERDLAPRLAADPDVAAHLAMLRQIGMYSGMCVPLLARGQVLGALTLVLYGPRRRRGYDAADLAAVRELARRAGTALDNALRFEEAERARGAAELAERRVAFLARASTELASSLNPRSTLDTVARLAVPALADWCFVEMWEETDGGGPAVLAPVVVLHSEPAKVALGWHIMRRYPLKPENEHGSMKVARTGEPELVFEFPEAAFAQVAYDAEHLRLMLGVGIRSTVQVPLRAGGRVVGVLTFATTDESGRRYGPADLALAGEVAARASVALENARLYDAERRTRAEAEEARRRAEEAGRAKSDFLATMSHEIRTPINAIVGYEELLGMGLGGELSEQQRDYLRRLGASARHLLGLVNDVLDLAKIDAGQMTLGAQAAPARDAVQAALAVVSSAAAARGVRLVDGSDCEPAVWYAGDADRVRQVLLNLLSNAIKFTEPGGEVRIDCGTAEEAVPAARVVGGGPWAYVRVADTGIGIPPDKQAAVFEPFVQLETGKTRTRGGTGLGLAISRRLARLMGGDLTLESAPGAGSAFTLWLPAMAGSAAPSSGTAEAPDERAARARRDSAAHRVSSLAEIGAMLREQVEEVLEAWEARLRGDPSYAGARTMMPAQLENHTLAFLADLTQSLVIVEQTGGLESDLLVDGSEIQRVIADRHGRQRRRLGWSEAQLAREYDHLREELSARVERSSAGPDDARLAVGVLARLLAHARDAAVRAFRAASS